MDFIPNEFVVIWISSFITTVGLFISSIIAGYYHERDDDVKRYIALSVEIVISWLISVTIFASVVYYGNVQLSLVQESTKLAGIDDRNDIKLRLYKLRVLNYAIGIKFSLLSISLLPVALLYNHIASNFVTNFLVCLCCNVLNPIFDVALKFIIIYLEITTQRSSGNSSWKDRFHSELETYPTSTRNSSVHPI